MSTIFSHFLFFGVYIIVDTKKNARTDKFDLMEKITSSFPSTYAAAHWLRKQNDSLGRSPAEAIMESNIEDVYAALCAEKQK